MLNEFEKKKVLQKILIEEGKKNKQKIFRKCEMKMTKKKFLTHQNLWYIPNGKWRKLDMIFNMKTYLSSLMGIKYQTMRKNNALECPLLQKWIQSMNHCFYHFPRLWEFNKTHLKLCCCPQLLFLLWVCWISIKFDLCST